MHVIFKITFVWLVYLFFGCFLVKKFFLEFTIVSVNLMKLKTKIYFKKSAFLQLISKQESSTLNINTTETSTKHGTLF